MKSKTAFQFQAGRSFFHRLDPLSKFAWLIGISLLAFGAYIAWIQITIAVAVLLTALLLARLSPLEIIRGTWLFIVACLGFFVVQSSDAARPYGRLHHPVDSRSMPKAWTTRWPRPCASTRLSSPRWSSCARPIRVTSQSRW